jgi:hypothetical protein
MCQVERPLAEVASSTRSPTLRHSNRVSNTETEAGGYCAINRQPLVGYGKPVLRSRGLHV